LQAYLEAGLDEPILMMVGSIDQQLLALQLALEVCGPRPPEA
jgi:hypothetical protein